MSTRSRQHQLLETLNRPCIDPDTGISYFDRPSWLATHVRYVDICGLSFVKPEDANGRGLGDLVRAEVPPTHLWPLQAQYVWPTREPNSALIKQFKYFTEYYNPEDILMIRLRPSPRDPYGADTPPCRPPGITCSSKIKASACGTNCLALAPGPI